MKIRPDGSFEDDDAGVLRMAAYAVVGAIVILGLYYGQDLLIPVAVAILLAFILGPVVNWMQRLLPLPVAVAVTVLAAGVVAGLLAAFVLAQLTDLAGSIASYQSNLSDKVQQIRKLSEGDGALSRFYSMVATLGNELAHDAGAAAPAAPTVRVQSGGAIATIADFIIPVLGPILTVGIIVILLVFMLLERDHLADRVVRLAGAGDVHATTEAVVDAAARLARVLSFQLLTNFGFSIVVSGGLYAIGMPNAILWGLLGGALRYIPYAGTALGALLPALIALAVSPGWLMPVLVLGWIVACDIVLGQIIEPLLFGETTGVSPLALLVSAIFWGSIWGPVGLLLSTPLTVCLLVLGKHVARLTFLDVLLGDEPALPVHLQLYNRLMRRSVADASAIVAAELEENGVEAGLDDSLGRMVSRAEADRAAGRLSASQIEDILAGTEDVLEFVEAEKADPAGDATPAPGAASDAPVSFACVGSRGQIDIAAAAVIAFALRQRGLEAVSRKAGEKLPDDPAPVFVLCYASRPSQAVRRYAMRKLALAAAPDTALHVTLSYLSEAVPANGAGAIDDMIEGTLSEIAQSVSQVAARLASSGHSAAAATPRSSAAATSYR